MRSNVRGRALLPFFFSLFFRVMMLHIRIRTTCLYLFCNNNYVRVQSSFLPSSSNPIQASLRTTFGTERRSHRP